MSSSDATRPRPAVTYGLPASVSGVPLAAFLDGLAGALGPDADPADPLTAARRAFAAAGMAALTAGVRCWAQRGLGIAAAAWPDLAGELARTTREWRAEGLVDHAFHLHKQPGVRMRWHATSEDAAPDLRDRVDTAVARWRRDGLVRTVVGGVYEPEHRLFGGPGAMPHVHRLFTVDSLFWMERAAARSGGPAWAPALLLLRALLDGLDVSGWEEHGVWTALADRCGRRLPSGGAGVTAEDVALLAGPLAAAWRNPAGLRETVLAGSAGQDAGTHADTRDAHASVAAGSSGADLDRALQDLRAAAGDWAGYFTTPAAATGPREAAAFVTVFSWNRAGLDLGVQALLVAALHAATDLAVAS